MAKNNAERAGVADDIVFTVKNIEDFSVPDEACWLVTNPPYGERLTPPELANLYTTLENIFEKENVRGGMITNYADWEANIDKKLWRDRKLYNGNIPARYWMKREFSPTKNAPSEW